MTVVVGLDSVGVVGVGLPASRTSPHRPHQAGGDLIVVVPKSPGLAPGSLCPGNHHFALRLA